MVALVPIMCFGGAFQSYFETVLFYYIGDISYLKFGVSIHIYDNRSQIKNLSLSHVRIDEISLCL